MQITVKSPTGTDIQIDLAANTVSISKINMINEPINGWGVTNHEGDNVQYVNAGGKNIIVAASYFKALFDARTLHRQQALEKAVPGITLLQAAMRSEADYFEAMQRMMEDEMNDGVHPPTPAQYDLDELKAKYQRAALYLKADAYSQANHYAKSAAGTKAKNLLENGSTESDAEQVLSAWLKGIDLD